MEGGFVFRVANVLSLGCLSFCGSPSRAASFLDMRSQRKMALPIVLFLWIAIFDVAYTVFAIEPPLAATVSVPASAYLWLTEGWPAGTQPAGNFVAPASNPP